MWGCSESVLLFEALPRHLWWCVSVMRSCAAGYVKVGIKNNSRIKIWKNGLFQKDELEEEKCAQKDDNLSQCQRKLHDGVDVGSIFWHRIAMFLFTKVQLEAEWRLDDPIVEGCSYSDSLICLHEHFRIARNDGLTPIAGKRPPVNLHVKPQAASFN